MVVLTRIYTRGGDAGETSLGDGTRVPKDDLRIMACGAVDEANSVIGVARLHTKDLGRELAGGETASLDEILAAIQNDLFDLGSDLTVPEASAEAADATAEKPRLRVSNAQVEALEKSIDLYNPLLQPLTSFVLPGGTPAAANLHLARVAVRHAERQVLRLGRRDTINPVCIQYLNRLSDFLFVAARIANDPKMAGGGGDILWEPGKNR